MAVQATLKSALDQVEKRVRDVINFIEGQLARALASITPEQKAELEEAFKHFDKSQDGKLNQVEFSAAMKSMDFEGVEAEFPKYSDCKSTNAEGFTEMAISFDSFLTIVLQQYKDKDTMGGCRALERLLIAWFLKRRLFTVTLRRRLALRLPHAGERQGRAAFERARLRLATANRCGLSAGAAQHGGRWQRPRLRALLEIGLRRLAAHVVNWAVNGRRRARRCTNSRELTA